MRRWDGGIVEGLDQPQLPRYRPEFQARDGPRQVSLRPRVGAPLPEQKPRPRRRNVAANGAHFRNSAANRREFNSLGPGEESAAPKVNRGLQAESEVPQAIRELVR